MASVERILIVGGGIGGLALAAALHRQGFAPELVERSDAWRTTGTGLGVMGNGMRMLERIGAADAVARAGAVMRRWTYCDAQGEVLCTTDLEALWDGVGLCVGVERRELQRVLLTAAQAVPARLGVSPVAFDQGGNGVTVVFDDGSHRDYDLVVGADGIRSTVRALALGGSSPRFAGQVVWRGVVATRPCGLAEMTVVMGEGRFFGLVPMGGGRTYGFGGLDAPEPVDDPMEGRLDRMRRLFADLGGAVPSFLAALGTDEDVRYDVIEWIDAERWHDGRVVLIGDAAHASPPHMGQGGAMAMEDAVVLAEILGAADSVEGALAAFVARRRPRTDWVQEQSRAALAAWLLPPDARNAALRERGDQMMRARFAPLREAP